MNHALRREYLAGLGFESWVLRGKAGPAIAPRDLIVPTEAPVLRGAAAPSALPLPRPDSPAARDPSAARGRRRLDGASGTGGRVYALRAV